MRRLAATILVALALAGCTGGKAKAASDNSSLACDHFRNVMRDGSQGILTDAELRAKLIEVKDNATIGTPAVEAASVKMLAAATSGTDTEFADGIDAMDAACDAAGHAN